MNFGDRDAMLTLAKERMGALKTKYPKAQLLDADQVRTIFLIVDDPAKYHKKAVASLSPGNSRKLGGSSGEQTCSRLLRVLRLGRRFMIVALMPRAKPQG